jgi:adenylate cyclase
VLLFAFATTHFLNHALGLVDLKTMHEVEAWRKIITRSVPGTIVLSGALLTRHPHDDRGVDGCTLHRP